MLIIELTEIQRREIALEWIKSRQQAPEGYKEVLEALFRAAHFARWGWDSAILYAVKYCAENYHVKHNDILKMLKEKKQ
jgi:hypothetical protein